jgi:hypothetical protein
LNLEYKRPILEVLDMLRCFNPIKVCFNDVELYNDYNSTVEIEPGVVGETLPYMVAISERIKNVLDEYDVLVTKLELLPVSYHHSLVYLYGEKIKKGYFDIKGV